MVKWLVSFPVHNQPVNDTLFVGATCDSTTATTSNVGGAEKNEAEIDLTALWYYPYCQWAPISIHPQTSDEKNRAISLPLKYDTKTQKASITLTTRYKNVGGQPLRMKVLRPPSTLHVAWNPDGSFGFLTGIDANKFTITTNDFPTELDAKQREFTTGQELEFKYKIEADLTGSVPGIYGTQLTFYGFESVLPAEKACRFDSYDNIIDYILHDGSLGGAPSFYFHVQVPFHVP